jgi:hypothetical protein
MILAEVSVMPRYSGDANLLDLLGFLADHGFDLVDLPAMEQDEAGGRLRYVDAAFLRRGT